MQLRFCTHLSECRRYLDMRGETKSDADECAGQVQQELKDGDGEAVDHVAIEDLERRPEVHLRPRTRDILGSSTAWDGTHAGKLDIAVAEQHQHPDLDGIVIYACVVRAHAVENQMPVDLRFVQDEVDDDDNEIILGVLVDQLVAVRAMAHPEGGLRLVRVLRHTATLYAARHL